MRVGRRRVAVVAAVLVAVAAGTGVARAYYAPGTVDVGGAQGYFTFCADRQKDIAGLADADLSAKGVGIDNYVYEQPGPIAALGTIPFVFSKSGIQYDLPAKRILTTQLIEYGDPGSQTPVQVRCKLRTRESLVRPITDLQNVDAVTNVPWGFGLAAGPGKSCRTVQEELVQSVWARIVADGKQAEAVYAYGTPSVVLAPDNIVGEGPSWTISKKVLSVSSGVLTIDDLTLVSPSSPLVGPERFSGAHYCTFVAPDYLYDVMLGGPVF
jgi:hypothetical protein